MKELLLLEELLQFLPKCSSIRIAENVGKENIIKQAKKLGIISNISNNPSMALGVDSFSLLETVGSFWCYLQQ